MCANRALNMCVCCCGVCVRSTIERHLLSSATDPFSRAPLSMEQLQPAAELVERMQQWRTQHRGARAAAAQQEQQEQALQQEEQQAQEQRTD